jgi:hypothetical protein
MNPEFKLVLEPIGFELKESDGYNSDWIAEGKFILTKLSLKECADGTIYASIKAFGKPKAMFTDATFQHAKYVTLAQLPLFYSNFVDQILKSTYRRRENVKKRLAAYDSIAEDLLESQWAAEHPQPNRPIPLHGMKGNSK